MPNEEDVTLTDILNQTKQVEYDYDVYVSTMENVLEGKSASGDESEDEVVSVESILEELDDLIKKTDDPKDKNTLLQYKSSLFQIRSQIKTEMKDMKTQLKGNKQIANATEKVIKWILGDIF